MHDDAMEVVGQITYCLPLYMLILIRKRIIIMSQHRASFDILQPMCNRCIIQRKILSARLYNYLFCSMQGIKFINLH